jgi:hypothetical protein
VQAPWKSEQAAFAWLVRIAIGCVLVVAVVLLARAL